MNKPVQLPIEGKAIRFAPGKNHEPAAWFWRVWIEGSDIYALTRTSNGMAKISVHASGQIHCRMRPKQKLDFAPLMKLGSGPWFHAFELRFLLSEGARTPKGQKDSLKNKSAQLISVPNGFVLYANLIVGARGMALNSSLPVEFAGGQALWRARLTDGRPAVLVGRLLPLNNHNREQIKYIRETLKPTATFTEMPKDAYIEIQSSHWSPQGGNVVVIIPMGDEAIRSEEEMAKEVSFEKRQFRYESSRSTVDIIAPNGLRVALLEIDEVAKQIDLVKNQPSTHSVGTITMGLEPSHLIAGSEFMASPCRLACVPRIGGGSPRTWEYTVFARFDGFALSTEIQPISCSLRNKNIPAGVNQLADKEELIMAIPSETLKILATMDAPLASTELLGRFTLCDAR